MGLEIDKINGNRSTQELAEMYKLNAQKSNTKKVQNEDLEQKEETKLDTYDKHKVSNSIEKQIQAQEAKIKELSKNLEGLREEYATTAKAEHEARMERYQKEILRHQKEVSENILKRIFFGWKAKLLNAKRDAIIDGYYRSSYKDFELATDAKKVAMRDYDLADVAAYEAIHAHNIADAHYLTGLWIQQDAYWDLLHLQRRKMIARMRENMLR